MCSSSRSALLFFLTVSLILILARQTFDLIGRLWLAILVNFIHLLFIIFALFGVVQFRLRFINLFLFWTPFCLVYNIFIFCFYMELGEFFDRNQLYLSAGLKQGHSFWLRYTPYCDSHYNISTGFWTQDTYCFLPYFYLESTQAILNISICLVIFITTLFFLCSVRKKPAHFAGTISRRVKNQPTITMEISDPIEKKKKTADRVMAFPINDRSMTNHDNWNDSLGYMNMSYEQSSITEGQNGQFPSSLGTDDIIKSSNYCKVPSGGYRRRNQGKSRKKRKVQAEVDGNLSVDKISTQRTRSASPHREQILTRRPSGSSFKKPFKHSITEGVARITNDHPATDSHVLRNYADFQRINRGSNHDLASLVNFDPKSKMQEHIEHSLDSSRESGLFNEPGRRPIGSFDQNRISYDSGMPGSYNEANSDWSSGNSQRNPIKSSGYKSALNSELSSKHSNQALSGQKSPSSHYRSHYQMTGYQALMAYEKIRNGNSNGRPAASKPIINDQSLLV